MTKILTGDWADFLSVKSNSVSRAILMGVLPKSQKLGKTKSLCWDYSQYEGFVAECGGTYQAARKIMDAAEAYCHKKRIEDKYEDSRRIKRESLPKPETKPVHLSPKEQNLFFCWECQVIHPIAMKAQGMSKNRPDMCIQKQSAAAMKRALNAAIVAGRISILEAVA